MHRENKIREYNLNFDNFLPDNESLLIQFFEHIFRSGFVYHDSTKNEIEAGEWVIRDFFDQQAEVFFELVSRERLDSFISYLKNFDWSLDELKSKLCQRIMKAYDQLAKGEHHHFNIRNNIAKGLLKKNTHPLYDLMMYIETYYNLVLEKGFNLQDNYESHVDPLTKNYNLDDLMQLRNKIQDRLLGRELVKRILKKIAQDKGVSYESLINIEKKDRQYPPITFLRPSKTSLRKQKLSKSNNILKNSMNQNNSDLVELSIKPNLKIDQKKLYEEDLFSDSNNEDASSGENKNTTSGTNISSEKNKISTKDNIIEGEIDKLIDDYDNSSINSNIYDADVVFGNKKITRISMETFVKEYPDSALKFIFRKNLDGKPLVAEIEKIYFKWENRGLYRSDIKKFLIELMEWSEFPNIPNLELLQIIRDKIYELEK